MTATKAVRRAHGLIGQALVELDGDRADSAVIACHLQYAYDLLEEKVATDGADRGHGSGGGLPPMNHQAGGVLHGRPIVAGPGRGRTH